MPSDITALASISLLLALVLPLHCMNAWKPIVGPTSADHVYTSSSFSVKQSHPDYGSKSFANTNLRHLKPIHVAPTGHGAGLTADDSTALVTPLPLKAIPIAYEDEVDDFESLNSGYGVGEGRFLHDNHHQQCSLKKFAFNHDGTVVYNNKLPELQQFTICYWLRFTNHSGDHVILTYSAKNEPRAMQFWIANAKNVSYISMAIKGQQMYRLNYPFRMRQWHHTCSSWNGKTGEWQIWVKGERIGRGFHNSLVGHVIPSHGKLFSGGSSATGEISEGLHFEVTLIQIYRIALSAGKAHRDHKHHHVHMFDYEGQEVHSTTKAPPVINRPQPMHGLLANGQIPTRLRINLANPQSNTPSPPVQFPGQESAAPPLPGAAHLVTLNTNFVNGQMNAGALLLTQQLVGQPAGPNRGFRQRPQISQRVYTQPLNANPNSANVEYVDETETRILFKRQTNATAKVKASEKGKKKRELYQLQDGSIVHDSQLNGVLKFDGLAEFGGRKFKDDLNVKMSLEDEISEHDREPAEEEVRAVMALCSACDQEPFKGAIIMAWKDIVEEMDNALKGAGSGRCGDF